MCDTSSIRGLYRPVADTATAEDPASLPTAADAERHAAAEHQQCGLGLRFFFTVTLRPAGSARRLTVVPYPRRIPAVLSVEEVTPPVRGGNSAEVQGGVRHRLRRRAARLGGCRAQGRRLSTPPRRVLLRVRARQGGKDRHANAVATAARTAALWCGRAAGSLLLPGGWLFPGRNPVERCRPSVLSCRPRRRQAGDQEARLATHAAAQLRTHLLEQDVDIA